MLENFVMLLVFIFAFPAGYILAYMTRDELLNGRKWFVRFMVVSLACLCISLILWAKEFMIVFSFMSIVTIISYWKSFDKKWTKRKI